MDSTNKHYYRTDASGVIIAAFSDAFHEPQEGDTEALDSDGGRHFNPPLYNDRMQLMYRLEDGCRVERSQEELDAEWAARPPDPPTPDQKIAELEAKLAASEAKAEAKAQAMETRVVQNSDDSLAIFEMLDAAGLIPTT